MCDPLCSRGVVVVLVGTHGGAAAVATTTCATAAASCGLQFRGVPGGGSAATTTSFCRVVNCHTAKMVHKPAPADTPWFEILK